MGTFGAARETRSARPPGAGRYVSIVTVGGCWPGHSTWPAMRPVGPVQCGSFTSVAVAGIGAIVAGTSHPATNRSRTSAPRIGTDVPEQPERGQGTFLVFVWLPRIH